MPSITRNHPTHVHKKIFREDDSICNIIKFLHIFNQSRQCFPYIKLYFFSLPNIKYFSWASKS